MDPEKERLVLAHIDSFPRSNHYRRDHSPHREYISVNGVSSVADMHELYIRWMRNLYQKGEIENLELLLASESSYRYILNTHRNIGFSKYGDKCETCDVLETSGNTDSKAYKRHREVESEARRQHQQLTTEQNEEQHFVVCDKGSVKLVPKLNVDFSFYLPRLSLIPMTIHAPRSHDSVTFWWTENEGGRGPSEIITAINMYLQSLAPTVRHLRLHFDNCAAENKSQYNVYPAST